MRKMLANDLMFKEEEYLTMLRKYLNMFIIEYTQIVGVSAIEHQIELKL